VYSAVVGNAGGLTHQDECNQFLGTHNIHTVFPGAPILTPNGTGGFDWFFVLGKGDVDQPFTMSGTGLGRVVIPLLPVGNGADLLVSICQDNAGVPGTMLNQTRIPASWILQQAAVSGIAQGKYDPPIIEYTGNPLATGQNNGVWSASITQVNWPYPYTTSTAAPSATFYGGFMIQAGGVVSGATINNVFTIPYSLANGVGVLSQAIPQAAYPTVFDGSGKMCVAIDSVTGGPVVVIAGGSTTFLGTPNTTVYTSSIDTTSGALSAWSSQQALPSALQNQATCSANGYVYLCGGIPNPAGNSITQVLYAQVSNGQITQWKTGPPLPIGLSLSYAISASGFLFVIGGSNAVGTPVANVYYSAINSDGSLGPWLTGPPLPTAQNNLNGTVFSNDNMIFVNGGSPVYYGLGVTQAGPATEWNQGQSDGAIFDGAIDNGDGSVTVFGLAFSNYNYNNIYLTPRISVPIPIGGLTNGTTYHVLMQQQGGDLNNYLRMHADLSTFPGNPVALSSNPGAYTWSNAFDNFSVPLEIYNNNAVVQNQIPLHTWEDGGARITTILTTTTPDQLPLGLLEATSGYPSDNSNTGFENGTSPWVATGGTLVQSSLQSWEGLYSGQVTPSGSAATVSLESELLPTIPGQSIQVSCRAWFTSAVTSNFSLSVNWYTLGGVFISTSSNFVSVGAGAWSPVSNTFTAPATAYQYTIHPTLQGTPAAGQVWYLDTITGGSPRVGMMQSSSTFMEYNAIYPSGAFTLVNTTVVD
jgi:hypothetical protein